MTHVSGNPTWQDFASGGTPINAQALEAIEAVLDGGVGGSVGWWSGFPIPPIGFDQRQTSPFLVSARYYTFSHITGPMWLPGPQTVDLIGTRTNVAGAAGAVGNVYYQANVAATLPDRSTATAVPDTIALDGATGRHEVALTTALVIPAEGMWFWFESTDTTAQVRVGSPCGPGMNWSGAGSLDAAGLPVVGSNSTNSDLDEQYAPALFFRRSA